MVVAMNNINYLFNSIYTQSNLIIDVLLIPTKKNDGLFNYKAALSLQSPWSPLVHQRSNMEVCQSPQ